MAILVFLLGALLTILGSIGLFASVDLLPTEIGILYAACGTIAASSGLVVISIGALIRRVDALSRNWNAPPPDPTPFETHAAESEPSVATPADEEPDDTGPERLVAATPSDDFEDAEPINENRAGHLPTLAEVEHAITEPGAAPTLVGRYTAAGAHYMIFSDGTIEAETEQGAFRFASMGDFKAYIAGRK
jgi:hypothetical protein